LYRSRADLATAGWPASGLEIASAGAISKGDQAMSVLGIDHILLAMPAGAEAEARAFYTGVLLLHEKVKPPVLAARGGAWFTNGTIEVHLGVEKDFRPARKAHPAFVVRDLDGFIERAQRHGCEIATDEPLPGYSRVFIYDPFGNRLELIEPQAA
jgi:catechol 2,3-dioxygenase-like lactoylglutathione lyase family enzyme